MSGASSLTFHVKTFLKPVVSLYIWCRWSHKMQSESFFLRQSICLSWSGSAVAICFSLLVALKIQNGGLAWSSQDAFLARVRNGLISLAYWRFLLAGPFRILAVARWWNLAEIGSVCTLGLADGVSSWEEVQAHITDSRWTKVPPLYFDSNGWAR